MSQLEQDIKALEEREIYYTNEIERIAQTEPLDQYQYSALKGELETVQAKLAVLRSEQAAIDAQTELTNQFDSIEVAGIPFVLRELVKGPEEYSIVSAYFQKYVGDMAQQHATVLGSYKSQVEQLEEEVQELENTRKLSYELSDKLADMEARRDAAAAELLNAQEEIKRLTADNTALRTQLESQGKPVATNLNTNLAEIAQKLHDKKPAIYNKRWKINERGLEVRTHYTAELAETSETIDIPLLNIGQYRELNEDEAARFRAELENQKAIEAARMAEEAMANISLVVPQLPFQEESTAGLDEHGTVHESNAPVTRQEFEELKHEVAQMKQTYKVAV
jgi:chromosome segregation ATPase